MVQLEDRIWGQFLGSFSTKLLESKVKPIAKRVRKNLDPVLFAGVL